MTQGEQEIRPGYSPPDLPEYTYIEQNAQRVRNGDAPFYVMPEKATVNSSAPKQCHQHGTSQTPHLDAQFADPRAKASLQELSYMLSNAAQDGMCLECIVEGVTATLGTMLREIKVAKKNGQISKKERWALKGEAKWLIKDMKHTLRSAWKRKP